MRIHSDFRDYYDTAMGYGQDPTLHYDRRERRHRVSDLKARAGVFGAIQLPYEYTTGRHRICLVVGFCGRLYPAVCFELPGTPGKPLREHVYTEEDFLKACEAQKIRLHGYGTRAAWHDYFAERSAGDDIFREVAAPAFVVRYDEGDWRDGRWLHANAPLKDMEFYKVRDAFAAFQDIAGYLGNQLLRRDEPLQVADRYRIAQHGFDKWSFRKPPA